MDLFDPEIALSERMRAAEMLYARCSNPLDFWLQALPKMPAMQVGVRVCVDHSFTLSPNKLLSNRKNMVSVYVATRHRPDRLFSCRSAPDVITNLCRPCVATLLAG